jgi:antirestriction protein ArdC
MPQSPTRAAAHPRPANDRSSLYEEITSKIIADLEAGCFPWVQPWGSSGVRAPLGLPKNAATGRRYSGINVLILWSAVVENGYSVQSWLTFKQALAIGGHVRKGERGTTVVYADRFVPDNERQRAHERGEAPRAIPFLKRFTVFNVEQCQDLPEGMAAAPPPVDTDLILPQAEALIRAIGADLRIGGDKAYYDVTGDFIRVPPPQAFYEPINWTRTVCHEHVHWAGAAHRLNRDLSGSFGSRKYAEEELVGEVGAAMMCAALGVVPTVRHADYLGAWLDLLGADHRAIVRAASAASKAADYLLAFLPYANGRATPWHDHNQQGQASRSHIGPNLRHAGDREGEGGGERRDGLADAGREAPGRPVAENPKWPSRNPRLA